MPLISTAVLPEESGCISSPKVETTIQQTSAICFQSELRKKLLIDWCLFFTNKKYQNCHLDLAKEAYPCFIDSNRNSKSLVNLILTHALSRMYWEFFSSVTGPILLCTLVPLHLLSYFTSSQSKGHPTHKIQQVKRESNHNRRSSNRYRSNSFATRLPMLLPITERLKIRKKWNEAEINLCYIQYE